MRSKSYIGVDNGVTGSIGIIPSYGEAWWEPMPVRKELSYTKAKKYISRIDVEKLRKILNQTVSPCMALIERPMTNPVRMLAMFSGMRALEATLIVLEEYKIPFQYVDSKEWQKVMLPSGLKGDELKKASVEVARRLWPSLALPKGRDADSLLMAEWARRKGL